jgi:hypothetical protein
VPVRNHAATVAGQIAAAKLSVDALEKHPLCPKDLPRLVGGILCALDLIDARLAGLQDQIERLEPFTDE